MEATTTVYKVYLQKGIMLTRDQLNAAGLKARNLYEQIAGELPPKIAQQEPTSLNYQGKSPVMITYQVFAYPAEFEPIISNLLDEQVKKKAKKSAKQQGTDIMKQSGQEGK